MAAAASKASPRRRKRSYTARTKRGRTVRAEVRAVYVEVGGERQRRRPGHMANVRAGDSSSGGEAPPSMSSSWDPSCSSPASPPHLPRPPDAGLPPASLSIDSIPKGRLKRSLVAKRREPSNACELSGMRAERARDVGSLEMPRVTIRDGSSPISIWGPSPPNFLPRNVPSLYYAASPLHELATAAVLCPYAVTACRSVPRHVQAVRMYRAPIC